MITGNINDAKKYFNVHPHFKEAFDVLKSYTPENCENYKSDNVNIKVSETTTSDYLPDGEKKIYEAHRKYLDIHFVIDGEVALGYSHIKELTPTMEYNEKDDYQLFKGAVTKIPMKKGDFCVVFPEDAHIPAMSVNEGSKAITAVVKLLID